MKYTENDKDAADPITKFLDNLTSFLGEDNLTKEELAEELSANGFDPDQLGNELLTLLSEHAPTWKQKAERERKAALRELLPPGAAARRTRPDTELEIQNVINAMQELGATVSAGAYYQKFQEVTEVDLESMLRDLNTQFEALKKKNGND